VILLLADVAAPQPSWAGIITAVASLFTAFALVITALGVAMVNRRTQRRIDANQRATTNQLNVIHTLVNSTLTAAMQGQLDASRRELIMLLEMTDMQRVTGQPVSEDRKAAIGALRRTVDSMTTSMADREQQTRVANIQIANEAEAVAAQDH